MKIDAFDEEPGIWIVTVKSKADRTLRFFMRARDTIEARKIVDRNRENWWRGVRCQKLKELT